MNEQVSRREFQRSVGALALSGTLVPTMLDQSRSEAADEKGEADGRIRACNFQESYMTWDSPHRYDPRPYGRHDTPHGNLARIQLEAFIDVIDPNANRPQRFVLIAACRTEWVYAASRLFQIPSNEYRNIYSLTEERGMGRHITQSGGPSRGRLIDTRFSSLKIDVATFARTRVLRTGGEVVKATAANLPLVARTEIREPDGDRRYILQYPVKTMNFQPKSDSFQVDTGPLLVPDLASNAPKAIDRLEMAHVAYNQLDRAEFIIRRPTPITDAEGREVCRVLHYSEVHEIPARTVILAGEDR